MSRWWPALRIARRTVLRSPCRSLLIVLLVALPIAAATTLDILARTITSPEHHVQRQIGAADAVARGISAKSLRAVVPPGTRIAPNPLVYSAFLQRGRVAIRTRIVTADANEPLHHHYARVDDGRAPRSAGEVLLTRPLARRLDLLDDDGKLRQDAAITVRGGAVAQVTGIARSQFCLDCQQVIAAPSSQVARTVRRRGTGSTEYSDNFMAPMSVVLPGAADDVSTEQLLDLPETFDAGELVAVLPTRKLGAPDAQLLTREQVAHPPKVCCTDGADRLRDVVLVAVLVGFGLLEIVLLAGTAFAVGARRQQRELGIIAASGAGPRDVRRVVLAQGLVLGALGAGTGILAGAALVIGGRPLWERLYNESPTAWTLVPWEIAAIALIGLLSGLAAAVVPAVGAARMRPVDALAGRFRASSATRRRSARTGGALLLAGIGCGLAGDQVLAADLRRTEPDAGFVHRAEVTDPVLALIVGGTTLAVIGLVLLAPVLIGQLARLGTRLPLSARLAVRDAERHRHRTGPATAAIALAVAGAVLTAFVTSMMFRADELSQFPRLPEHVIAVKGSQRVPAVEVLAAAKLAAARLPGGRAHAVRLTGTGSGAPHLVAQRPNCSVDDALAERCRNVLGSTRPAVVHPQAAAASTMAGIELDGDTRAALTSGNVIVFEAGMLDRAGKAVIEQGARQQRLPGHLVKRDKQYARLPSALISTSLARSQRWPNTFSHALVSFSSDASEDDIDAAMASATTGRIGAFIDDRPNRQRNAILLIAGIIAGLVTLFGVAISVALSAAEGRADLATLAAVGAPPRRRRALVATQALLIGGLGGLLGISLGAFVAFTARAATGSPDFVVPWWNLAAAAIAAPLMAAFVAALCTRGRLPLTRRAE